ncbi:N-acetylmuramoyl-L-alanine amidase, partial [bacterium]|nr:N-acetylmuramoyl-L-alanine amidase [bacterium]
MRILKNIFTATVVTCLLALPAVAASTSVASASSVEVVEVVRAAESTQTTSGISFECKTECLSNWYKSSAGFSAVVFNFSELAERELREIESLEHEHAEPGAFVQFEYLDGGLSKWVYFEPDIDGTTTYTERTALVNTKTATGFRVKHSLDEDFISGFELLGLDTTKSTAASETASARRNLLAGVDFLELGVIPRTVWGGFEKTHSKLKLLASRSFLPNFSQLYKVDDPEILQVSGFKDNKALFWPREYAKDIKMIVIHHTASTRELDNPTQAIKNIHEYHTNVKQWGDIGYHYIVAPDGKIFEGRAGGPGVIGGHSYDVNKVSVGISVMGNYESDQVSNATMQALAKLIEKLVLQHDLDINAKVAYKKMQIDVLAGHRDTGKTLCPGKNLYSRLNELRSWVSSNLELNPKAFKLGSANDFKLAGNSQKTIQISLTNKSSDTWQRGKTKLLPKSTEARAYLQGNMQWQMVRGSGKPNTTNIFEANLETLNNA